jgi:RNA polymerase sigma factor (sigma-70 family)
MGVGDVRQLVQAAASGDQRAWDELVERFSGLVWSVIGAYRLGAADAADVFQTTWLRLVEHLRRLEHPERVGGWLATTARREAIRVARAAWMVVPTEDHYVLESPSFEQSSPEALAIESDRARRLWQAFQELSARCQELLRVLLASPPMTYLEIAAVLEMPIGSIGPTRSRCLQDLRARLAARDGNAI